MADGAEFRHRVQGVVRSLKPGEVVSYGDVAAEAGSPGAARAVGAVMASCDDDVPWWRVVYASGRFAAGLQAKQQRLLEAEGVTVRDGRVVARPEASAVTPRPVSSPARR